MLVCSVYTMDYRNIALTLLLLIGLSNSAHIPEVSEADNEGYQPETFNFGEYQKHKQQDPQQMRYEQQQKSDSLDKKLNLRARKVDQDQSAAGSQETGVKVPAPSVWKVVHPKFVTEKTHEEKAKIVKKSLPPNSYQVKEIQDRSDCFSSENNLVGKTPKVLQQNLGGFVGNHQNRQLQVLNSLLGQQPSVQLHGLKQLLNTNGPVYIHKKDHTPIKEDVVDIPNPQSKPNVKVQHNQDDMVKAIQALAQNSVSSDPNSLKSLQAQLDATASAHAEAIIAQAQQQALEQVQAQHAAIAKAQVEAEKAALAQINAQNEILNRQHAENEARNQAEIEGRKQAEYQEQINAHNEALNRQHAENQARNQAEIEGRKQAEYQLQIDAHNEALNREQAKNEARKQAEIEGRKQAEYQKQINAHNEALNRQHAENEARNQAEIEGRKQAEYQKQINAHNEALNRQHAENKARNQPEIEGRKQAEYQVQLDAHNEALNRQHAKNEARKQAEYHARQAELEAARQAEIAERKQAREKSENEARRKAELEAIRLAEAAVRQAELEDRRNSEIEARKHAEFQARRQSELEARRQSEAENEAKMIIENEARRQFEALRQSESDARRKAQLESKRKYQAEQEARKAEEHEKQRRHEEYRLKKEREQAKLRRKLSDRNDKSQEAAETQNLYYTESPEFIKAQDLHFVNAPAKDVYAQRQDDQAEVTKYYVPPQVTVLEGQNKHGEQEVSRSLVSRERELQDAYIVDRNSDVGYVKDLNRSKRGFSRNSNFVDKTTESYIHVKCKITNRELNDVDKNKRGLGSRCNDVEDANGYVNDNHDVGKRIQNMIKRNLDVKDTNVNERNVKDCIGNISEFSYNNIEATINSDLHDVGTSNVHRKTHELINHNVDVKVKDFVRNKRSFNTGFDVGDIGSDDVAQFVSRKRDFADEFLKQNYNFENNIRKDDGDVGFLIRTKRDFNTKFVKGDDYNNLIRKTHMLKHTNKDTNIDDNFVDLFTRKRALNAVLTNDVKSLIKSDRAFKPRDDDVQALVRRKREINTTYADDVDGANDDEDDENDDESDVSYYIIYAGDDDNYINLENSESGNNRKTLHNSVGADSGFKRESHGDWSLSRQRIIAESRSDVKETNNRLKLSSQTNGDWTNPDDETKEPSDDKGKNNWSYPPSQIDGDDTKHSSESNWSYFDHVKTGFDWSSTGANIKSKSSSIDYENNPWSYMSGPNFHTSDELQINEESKLNEKHFIPLMFKGALPSRSANIVSLNSSNKKGSNQISSNFDHIPKTPRNNQTTINTANLGTSNLGDHIWSDIQLRLNRTLLNRHQRDGVASRAFTANLLKRSTDTPMQHFKLNQSLNLNWQKVDVHSMPIIDDRLPRRLFEVDKATLSLSKDDLLKENQLGFSASHLNISLQQFSKMNGANITVKSSNKDHQNRTGDVFKLSSKYSQENGTKQNIEAKSSVNNQTKVTGHYHSRYSFDAPLTRRNLKVQATLNLDDNHMNKSPRLVDDLVSQTEMAPKLNYLPKSNIDDQHVAHGLSNFDIKSFQPIKVDHLDSNSSKSNLDDQVMIKLPQDSDVHFATGNNSSETKLINKTHLYLASPKQNPSDRNLMTSPQIQSKHPLIPNLQSPRLNLSDVDHPTSQRENAKNDQINRKSRAVEHTEWIISKFSTPSRSQKSSVRLDNHRSSRNPLPRMHSHDQNSKPVRNFAELFSSSPKTRSYDQYDQQNYEFGDDYQPNNPSTYYDNYNKNEPLNYNQHDYKLQNKKNSPGTYNNYYESYDQNQPINYNQHLKKRKTSFEQTYDDSYFPQDDDQIADYSHSYKIHNHRHNPEHHYFSLNDHNHKTIQDHQPETHVYHSDNEGKDFESFDFSKLKSYFSKSKDHHLPFSTEPVVQTFHFNDGEDDGVMASSVKVAKVTDKNELEKYHPAAIIIINNGGKKEDEHDAKKGPHQRGHGHGRGHGNRKHKRAQRVYMRKVPVGKINFVLKKIIRRKY